MKIKSIVLFSLIALLFSSCKKEEGPAGPAGDDGTNGINGTNGNANVKAFMFIDAIVNSYYWSDTLPGINYKSLDSSLVLAYIQDYECGSNWYSVPGPGCLGSYTSRVWTNGLDTFATANLQLLRLDGTVNPAMTEDIRKLRVIVAPASFLVSGKKEIDYSDYYAVCSYLNINP